MKRLLIGVAGLVWFVLVFAITFWMTFPSAPLGDRVRLLVHQNTNGEYDVQMDSLRPWWFGASANNIRISSVKRVRGAPPVATPMFAVNGASVRVSPFGLKKTPHVSGVVDLGGSEVTFDAQGALNKRGNGYQATAVELNATSFPVADLAALTGTEIDATGELDFSADVESDGGMRSAHGDIKIRASNVNIASLDPSLTGGMDLGMEIPIDDIDLRIEIEDGKATIAHGEIISELATVALEGDVTMRDDVTRSTVNISATIELGDKLAMFKSFLKSAEWADGKFHYRCTGTVARNHCREDRERGGSVRAGLPSRGSTDADRERRKRELKDRLRENTERRAERTRERAARAPARDDLEDVGYVDEEDEEFDEDLEDEEGGEEFDDEEPVEGDEVFED